LRSVADGGEGAAIGGASSVGWLAVSTKQVTLAAGRRSTLRRPATFYKSVIVQAGN
jgi:hypothetical protein